MSKRILTILVAVIAVIGFILFGMVMGAGEEMQAKLQSAVSNMVWFSVILLILAIFIAVVASVLGVFKNPGTLKKTIFGVVGLVVVILVSYLVSDAGEVFDANGESIAATGSSASKLTSAGIWSSLILLVVGGAFFVYDLLKGLIK